MIQKLRHFVSQLRMLSDGCIIFRGEVVYRPPVSEAQNTAQTRLSLIECVYKYLYTHPDGDTKMAFKATPIDKKLLASLSAANTTTRQKQSGWVVHGLQNDGSIIAGRWGVIRKFMPGQFLADKNQIPVQTGTTVSVTTMAGSKNYQEGFYHVFSNAVMDMAEVNAKVRLYFHVKRSGAAQFVGLLSHVLNTYDLVFTFKIALRPNDYSRTDVAVLYLPRRMFTVAAIALTASLPSFEALLDEEIPFFTKRLAHGIGFADDPSTGGSFGASRCEWVADAILSAKSGEVIPADAFVHAFHQIIADRQLHVDKLYLNPGAADVPDFACVQHQLNHTRSTP